MHEERERLATIFAQVLSLDDQEVAQTATQGSTPTWDSMAHINLILAVEQEFRIGLSPEEATEAVSFEAMERLVAEKLGRDRGAGK